MKFGALLGLVLSVSSALAQDVNKAGPTTITLSDIQAAQLLILNNRLDDAKRVVEHVLATRPDDTEGQFLLANIAVAEKDYDTAISLFRRILVREPATERVRLELARAFFLKGDYDNADRQFRFARAGDIDDTVKANVDHFLSAINRLREWTVNFSFALAPDTNQNAATSASQVSIFGLPFALDKGARKQSGIGLAGDIGGEWSPLLGDTVKARIGADLTRVEYSGGAFDDMTVSAYGGPQFLFANWDVSILATGFKRWFANQDYVSGAGGKLAADYGIASNWVVGASVGGQAVTNAFIPQQSGPLWSVQTQAAYVLSPSSLFQLQLGFNRQDAQIAPYSYSSVWFGGGYSQDLPWGFSAGFQPSYFITRYDAMLAAFGKTRSDDAVMLAFTLLNRRFDYHGFTPRFSYVFTEQHSNIALYSFTRNQFQIGLTSLF
ncbi:MAG TPA: surface lipoprotein assembly modifier [Rhizomicrobium sp.]|nr:surface lipoprotein assembly modifier [Rhizomicrobium sp.]